MSEFLEKLKKEYGDHIVEDVKLESISTGVVSLDTSLGVGGIPRGRISVIYGAESSGKTTLCLSISRQCLLHGEKVLYIDVEHSLDRDRALALLGEDVNHDDFVLLHPLTAEDALLIAEAGIQGNKKLAVKPKDFSLVIIDSIGALAPSKEQEDDLTDSNVALLSKLITKFLRRNGGHVKLNNISLLFIGQVRDKIGGYGGYSISGGHALLHTASVILFLSKIKTITMAGEPVGILSSFTVKKNKVAPPFRKWDGLPIMFDSGIDFYKDLLDFSEMLGFIRKRGAFYYYEDENLGQGFAKASEYLKENPEFTEKLILACKGKRLVEDESLEETLDNDE